MGEKVAIYARVSTEDQAEKRAVAWGVRAGGAASVSHVPQP